MRAFLRAALALVRAFVGAFWFFHREALAVLTLPPGEALRDGEKRRLRHYYFGTTYLATVFCLLRGRRRTAAERRAFTYLAALASFFDDLADSAPAASQLAGPEAYGRAHDPRGLALHFLENFYRAVPPEHVTACKGYVERVFAVETRPHPRPLPVGGGGLHTSKSIHGEDLGQSHDHSDVAAEKGGCSVLLFRRALAHALSPAEEAALYAFGHLVQLCDDIFDVWFDRREGIHTLPATLLTAGAVDRLRDHFEAQVQCTREAFRQTPFAPARRAAAWQAVHFLVAITRVALDHYADLHKKHGTLPLDDRRQMVVDMARWRNWWRAAGKLMQFIDL